MQAFYAIKLPCPDRKLKKGSVCSKRIFDKAVLRGIFGPEVEKVREGWRKPAQSGVS
jgi:hypothetical protein